MQSSDDYRFGQLFSPFILSEIRETFVRTVNNIFVLKMCNVSLRNRTYLRCTIRKTIGGNNLKQHIMFMIESFIQFQCFRPLRLIHKTLMTWFRYTSRKKEKLFASTVMNIDLLMYVTQSNNTKCNENVKRKQEIDIYVLDQIKTKERGRKRETNGERESKRERARGLLLCSAYALVNTLGMWK